MRIQIVATLLWRVWEGQILNVHPYLFKSIIKFFEKCFQFLYKLCKICSEILTQNFNTLFLLVTYLIYCFFNDAVNIASNVTVFNFIAVNRNFLSLFVLQIILIRSEFLFAQSSRGQICDNLRIINTCKLKYDLTHKAFFWTLSFDDCKICVQIKHYLHRILY